MVSYDIPWNPARLEQRMGRIHRYGQKHDVRVVNLVAGGTHEGRVLKVLLEKLESVRLALSSDKVFDVIGRLLENVSLREYMMAALDREREEGVLEDIERALTESAVRRLAAREANVYGVTGEVAPRVDGMRQELDRERYLHLLPAYVRLFVESAARKLGIGIQGDLDGVFSLSPATRAPSILSCRRWGAIRPRCGSGSEFVVPTRGRRASGCTPASRCSTRSAPG